MRRIPTESSRRSLTSMGAYQYFCLDPEVVEEAENLLKAENKIRKLKLMKSENF